LDTVFEKEGAGWYLRYFIDKDADGASPSTMRILFARHERSSDQADPIEQIIAWRSVRRELNGS
jgi:ribosome maturation factor RimP